MLALALTGTSPASAQTQQQTERIEMVVRYSISSHFCEWIGFTVDDRIAYAPGEIIEELVKSGVDPDLASKLIREATARQLDLIKADFAYGRRGRSTPEVLADMKAMFMVRGQDCVATANDRLLAQYVTMPAGFDLAAAVMKAAEDIVYGRDQPARQPPTV